MTTPYQQSFVFTMESGAVLLVTVLGDDPKHGEGLAHSEAVAHDGGQVWDSCAYPVTAGTRESLFAIVPAYAHFRDSETVACDLS